MKSEGYVVMSLATHVEVCVGAFLSIKQEIPLNFAEGMVGAIPVFSSLEDAEAYCNGCSYRIEKITYKSKLRSE